MNPFAASLTVGCGAFLGANARYWIGVWVRSIAPSGFPWATLGINVLGCFLIGLVMGTSWGRQTPTQLFLVVGVLGGFTTFSAFGFETLTLLRTAPAVAGGYVIASVALGLVATWGGGELASRLIRS